VAPAVGGVAAPDSSRVRRRTWHGTNVDVGAVVAKLHEIQAELARHDVAQEEHPHPRNCVLNLVVMVDDRHRANACDRAIAGVAASHPLRAILVHPGGAEGEGKLDAEIVTEAHQLVSGFPVQREQVLLHVRGEAADHLASLVEPLLVPDVPTYLWWSGRERLDAATIRDAMTFSDVLVVDSALLEHPVDGLLQLAGIAADPDTGIAVEDFRWGRMRPWRDAIAQCFAPEDRRALLGGLREVAVVAAGAGADRLVGAALMAGWMAGALGWRIADVAARDDGLTATAEAGDERVGVELRSAANEWLHHGELLSMHLSGRVGRRPFALSIVRDPDGDPHAHVTIELGDRPPVRQRLALPRLGDPDLLVHVLWARLRDPVFERTLRGAVPLLEAAQ
jgi:glucose-6-phosphate dehydrogenase assembly protein OpcA